MITKYKIFEDVGRNKFYYIPYNKLYVINIAIEKIDITKELKEEIKQQFSSCSFTEGVTEGVCVGIINNPIDSLSSEYQYGLVESKDGFPLDSVKRMFINYGYIFGGEIKVEDWEISYNKYNM